MCKIEQNRNNMLLKIRNSSLLYDSQSTAIDLKPVLIAIDALLHYMPIKVAPQTSL